MNATTTIIQNDDSQEFLGVENSMDRDESLARIEIATLALIFLTTVLGNATVLLALWTRKRYVEYIDFQGTEIVNALFSERSRQIPIQNRFVFSVRKTRNENKRNFFGVVHFTLRQYPTRRPDRIFNLASFESDCHRRDADGANETTRTNVLRASHREQDDCFESVSWQQ